MKNYIFWMALLIVAPVEASEISMLGANLNGLLEYAREHNPDLAAVQFEAQAVQMRAESASALPDPVLRTELMDVGNQATSQTYSLLPWQVGGTRYLLMQSVPWLGKRDLQQGVANAQLEQANGQLATSWAELASQIKTNFATNYFLVANGGLTQNTRTLLENLEQVASDRYANGLGSQQDVIRVQLEVSALNAELISLQNERHHANVKLNALLSRPANAELAEPLQFRALPAPASMEEANLLEQLRAHNPQLMMAEAALQAAEKNRDLAQLNRYPAVTLGIAPTQVGGTVKSWDLMLEFSLPIQQAARHSQQGEAEAMRAAAVARQHATLNQLEAMLSENLSALTSARRTETLINQRLLPQSEMAFQSALVAYENGKLDFAVLISAQRQVLQAKQQQLKAQFEAQLRWIEIEKLLGEVL